jgi:hypothetical protein
MLKKQESNWDLEGFTDTQIFAAIRYLEADLGRAASTQGWDDTGAFVICVILSILGFGGLVFVCCFR